MKKTIELLKSAGVIYGIQNTLTEIKPPKGTSDEAINRGIFSILQVEMLSNDKFADDFIEAVFYDVADAIRNQVNIEYVEKEEFDRQNKAILHSVIDVLFGK